MGEEVWTRLKDMRRSVLFEAREGDPGNCEKLEKSTKSADRERPLYKVGGGPYMTKKGVRPEKKVPSAIRGPKKKTWSPKI